MLIIAVLLICAWAHVAEVFDVWDQTLHSGGDIEFGLMIVACCIGLSLACIPLLARRFAAGIAAPLIAAGQTARRSSIQLTPPSFSDTPLSLRI